VTHVAVSQTNFQLHLLAAALVVIVAVVLEVSLPEMAILALTIGFVVATEAVNTAIESAVDAIGGPPSLAAKRAKDSAAGAVLLSALVAVVIGLLILGPRFLSRLGM
jgi:diacylglycerol kinase